VLIDGSAARAPWIDLDDLRARGALVLWTDSDPAVMPVQYRSIAADAAIQPPFELKALRGDHITTVGWAILQPKRSFAQAD